MQRTECDQSITDDGLIVAALEDQLCPESWVGIRGQSPRCLTAVVVQELTIDLATGDLEGNAVCCDP